MGVYGSVYGGGATAVDPGSILVSAGGDYVPVATSNVRLGTTFGDGSSETGTLAVSGVEPPTTPGLSAVEVICLDADYAAAEGVDIDFRIVAIPTGDSNRSYLATKKTVTSNGSGIARYEGPQGATVEFKRGVVTEWQSVVLDSDSVSSVTSIIGSP